MSSLAFKNTDIGRIPSDWEVKKLGEVGSVKMCKRIFKHETSAEGNIPFFKIGTFGQIADAFISREKFESFKSLYPYPRKDTPLISAAGTIGRIVLHDGQDAYYQDSNIVWLEHDEREVLNSYLSYYYSVIKWVTETGSAITRLYNNQLLSALIAVPCIKEQHAIATVLSDMDALLEAKTALLEKKRAIKQGAMQELLTGKRRLPGFPVTPMKHTEIGELPEDWEVKTLGRCASIARGGSPRPIESYLTTSAEGVNWIKIGDVSPGAKYIEHTEEKILSSGVKHSRKVKPGDLLLSNSMSYGRPYILSLDGCIHDGWLTIADYDSEFHRDYLYYALSSSLVVSQYEELAAGTGVKNLNKKIVAGVQVPCPCDFGEQKAIASVLSDMDDELVSMERKLEKLVDLKQGMMQNLLTGHIRLV